MFVGSFGLYLFKWVRWMHSISERLEVWFSAVAWCKEAAEGLSRPSCSGLEVFTPLNSKTRGSKVANLRISC